MSRIQIYVKELNEHLDKLYSELDNPFDDFMGKYPNERRRKQLLKEIEKTEAEINQILGCYDQYESKMFVHDDEE